MVVKKYSRRIIFIFLAWIYFQGAFGQKQCYDCDSASGNSDCVNNYQNNTCENDDNEHLGCYHYEKGDVIIRGCVGNLTNDQLEDCNQGEFCKMCHEDFCNSKKTFQKCFTCNSADNPSCATLQSPLVDKTCDDYLDFCKVYVKPNMTTNRGCSKEMQQDVVIDCHPQAVNCRECSENNCNGEIFPPNRLSCFHDVIDCHDDNEKCFKSENNLSFPCEIYNFRDSCFLYLNENKTATRGCLSDSIFNEFCLKNPQKCKTCQSSNCNDESVIKTPKLSCIKCESSEECLWSFQENMATPCESHVFFYEEETCFTFNVSEKKIIRGCTLDSNLCKINECNYCDENGCNSQGYAIQSCYKCSSYVDKKCSDDLTNVEKVSCGIVNYESRGCFTSKDQLGYVQRGCISDLSNERKIDCMNNLTCSFCTNSTNCNNQLFNSSDEIKINKFLIVLIILANKMWI